jgi:WD40 repeat protein
VNVATGTSHISPIDFIGDGLSFDWTANGKQLIVAGRGKKIEIHDVARGAVVREFEVDREGTCKTAISPDGRWCAYSDPAGTIKILSADNGAARETLTGLAGAVEIVTFSCNGSFLAAADLEGRVRIWDVTTGRVTMATQLSDIDMNRVRFNPDGKLLAIAGNDVALRNGDVRILDTSSGHEITRLRGHTILVTDVAFSPDGKRVATCSDDRTIRIWDVMTGEEILTLKGHTDTVCSIRFLADGCQLVSASVDGTMRVWDATPLPQ